MLSFWHFSISALSHIVPALTLEAGLRHKNKHEKYPTDQSVAI